ncbi:MAG: DUF2029 domain-containing protein [Phyllobacteriaceae bacterium]|nr:DUF2029 domain-containing protein [Phyllobacteriaceae bacterium]
MTETARPGNPDDIRFAALVVFAGLAIAMRYLTELWTFDANGFSVMSDKLPYWDFTNLWAGSRMAISGHVADLFDVEAYRAHLRAMFSPLLPDQEWSYPPSMLLFGAPLALMPILPAYLIWTFATIFAFWLAIRPLRLGLAGEAALLASPAIVVDAIFGQNGALTAALLIGGLGVAPLRPFLGGILIGLLTIKPHLGALAPFALLATGNWRAILAAAATAALLAAATGLLFGFDVWAGFWWQTRPLMTAILEAPFPQPYHANAMTVFFLARTVGLDLTPAYALQALSALIAVGATIWLWRPARMATVLEKAVLTGILALLATPYGYTYDAIAVAAGVALLFRQETALPRLFLGLVWLFPYVAHLLNQAGFGIGVLSPLLVAATMMRSIARREEHAATVGLAAEPRPV